MKDYELLKAESKYSRTKFRIYLQNLPQDETFCKDNNCPITQFSKDELNIVLDNSDAIRLDLRYVEAIDSSDVYTIEGHGWSHITAKLALKTLISVQLVNEQF